MINNYSDVRTPVGFAKIQLYFDILNKIFQSFPPRVAPLAQSTHYHPPHPPHNPPRHNRGDAPPPAASTPVPPLRAAKDTNKTPPHYRFLPLRTDSYLILPISTDCQTHQGPRTDERPIKNPQKTRSHWEPPQPIGHPSPSQRHSSVLKTI
jgi:hypothetical protein